MKKTNKPVGVISFRSLIVGALVLGATTHALPAHAEDHVGDYAGDNILPSPVSSIEQATRQAQKSAMHSWERSLAPLVASQALDASSSYGLRERNPVLAGSDGAFGMKAVGIKFGVVGALIGVEYVLVRKSPRAARWLSMLNWTGAAVTTGLAVHNYAIR